MLQICGYVDQLEPIQGVRPDGCTSRWRQCSGRRRLRVDDYMAYYRSVKDRFLATVTDRVPAAYPRRDIPRAGRPLRCLPLGRGVRRRRRDDDHLSLVAGISARQRGPLIDRGCRRSRHWATYELPMEPELEGRARRRCAGSGAGAVRLEGRRDATNHFELLAPGPGTSLDPERGLASLPLPSAGDLFFDIEGDPYAFEDGLDYLFGVLEVDGRFHPFWSRDEAGEFTPGRRTSRVRTADGLLRKAARSRPEPRTSITTRRTSRPPLKR